MPVAKSSKQIKINSGNNFKIKDGASAYETLGNIVSGKLAKKAGTVGGTWADGYQWKKRGSVESNLVVVLGQVAKDVLDRVDTLAGKIVKIYFYNGKDEVPKHLEFYAPEGQIIEALELEMKGASHQMISLEIELRKSVV